MYTIEIRIGRGFTTLHFNGVECALCCWQDLLADDGMSAAELRFFEGLKLKEVRYASVSLDR